MYELQDECTVYFVVFRSYTCISEVWPFPIENVLVGEEILAAALIQGNRRISLAHNSYTE